MLPLFRREALTVAAGLRCLGGIDQFPYSAYFKRPRYSRLSWRNLDKLAEVALRTKAIVEPRFHNVLQRTFQTRNTEERQGGGVGSS